MDTEESEISTSKPGTAQHINKDTSTGDWFLSLFLLAIPVVGIVMLFFWAFSQSIETSKSNFAKAYLLWILIAVVIALLFAAAFGFSLFSLTDTKLDL